MEENTPFEILNLEEKIFAHFNNEAYFHFDMVKAHFPNENPRSIYRAIKKLEATQRIRFLKFHNRKKVYTTAGVSGLPTIKNTYGQHLPLSVLMGGLDNLYQDGRLKRLQEVNNLWVLMLNLFVIAADDIDGNERKRQMMQTYKQLIEMRTLLMYYIENIDAVINHPAMQGDVEVFERIFTNKRDSAVPTPQDLINFRRWVSKEMKLDE